MSGAAGGHASSVARRRPERVRVLVLSGATHVGRNVLETLATRRASVELIAASSVCDEPALFEFDAVHRVPPVADAGFEAALLRIVDAERIDLVIPCRDADVAFVGALRDRRPDLAPRLLVGTEAMARIIGDKGVSHRFCVEHDLPFAETIGSCDPDEQAAFVARHGFPIVAKPARGWASMNVVLVNTREQLARALARPGFVAQPFLGDPRTMTDFLAARITDGVPVRHDFQGVKQSIQAVVAPDGRVAGVFAMESMRSQRSAKRGVVSHAADTVAIGLRAAEAFAASGWRGPLNLQCRRTVAGALRIHEFSGRFTGATVDRWLLGFDEVGMAITLFTGCELRHDRPPRAPVVEALEATGYRALLPGNADAARLERDGCWRRAS
jgi:hypothetical protein